VQNIRDFIQDAMDIIIGNDQLNFETDEKIILSAPYHYDDPIAKACTIEIEETLENKSCMNVSV